TDRDDVRALRPRLATEHGQTHFEKAKGEFPCQHTDMALDIRHSELVQKLERASDRNRRREIEVADVEATGASRQLVLRGITDASLVPLGGDAEAQQKTGIEAIEDGPPHVEEAEAIKAHQGFLR